MSIPPRVRRSPGNPLIQTSEVKPSHPEMEVLGAFNPGATVFQGQRLLLVRIAERPIQEPGYLSTAVMDPESGGIRILRFRLDDPKLDSSDPRAIRYDGVNYLTSISHLRKAVSFDGAAFTVAESPTLAGEGIHETYGIEDARIVKLEDAYYISYSAVSATGIVTQLARTRDFEAFERLGIIFAPDNKDIAIFPEQVGGRYYTLHRPAVRHLGTLSIWIASSSNLLDWGAHRELIGPRPGFWDCERVGAGAAPLKTSEGWLELYHGADHQTRYCTGAVLLDLERPWKVLARSSEALFFPEEPYEVAGFMPNVVFHNGLVDLGGGELELYYGAADQVTCAASLSVGEILSTLKF